MNNNNLKESYGSLSETINALVDLGYIHDFNIINENIVSKKDNIELSPDDFQIDKVFRFEGATNPDDQAILYAISSKRHNVNGVLVNGYGISDDEATSKLIEKLSTNSENQTSDSEFQSVTSQNPSGDGISNAPIVEHDLKKFIKHLTSENHWTDSDRNSITIFKSKTMRIVLMGLKENAELKQHKANGAISVQVVEGKLKFTAEQKSITLEKGQMIALDESVTHAVKAITETFFLLTLAMNIK
jgi:quercetin dioxygenase-like cupin family protein